MLKSIVKQSVLIAAICLLSFNAHSLANDLKTVTVPPGDLAPALESLGKQFGIDVIYPSEQIRGLKTQGFSGTLDVQSALTKLLEGTPLTFRKDPSGAMLITLPRLNPLSSGEEKGEGIEDVRNSVRLAQAEIPPPRTGDGKDPQSGKGEGSETLSNESQELPAPEETGKAIPEFLVEGSKTLNADIERTENDIQPYVVFGAAEIERSQTANLSEFFKTRLPMNTASQSGAQTSTNQSEINLRGLGSNQTLILVDGRRMPSIFNNTDFLQPDINGIPLAAVERIEVLPASASGIYGGGATGGVINIITRKDYSGIDLQAFYGNTFDTDAANRRLDLSGGFSLEGGRTQVRIMASHADATPLLWGERDFTARARALQFANDPSTFTTPTAAAQLPAGYTANIRNASPNQNANLVLDTGTVLSSPFTSVPIGYAGPASDNGLALVANAGRYNLGVPNDAFVGARRSLLNDPTVQSATVNLRRDFGARVEAFVDVSWFDNEGRTFNFVIPNTSSVTLAANAANNPFTTAINVRFPAVGLQFPVDVETENVRALGGVIVRLPHDWSAAADYVWSRSRYSTTQNNLAVGDPDGTTGPGISYNTALTNSTLNVLRDLNAFPLDYSAYLLPSPNDFFGPLDTVLKDATLRVSGPVFHLPGGAITLSGVIARREEEARDSFRDAISINAVASTTFFPSRSQETDSYYLEASVPFVSAANAARFVRSLDFKAAVRRDEYDTRSPASGSAAVPSRDGPLPAVTYNTNVLEANKYTLGLRYAPLRDLTLRASFATAFRAPSFGELTPFPPFPVFPQTVIDPKRGGVSGTASFITFNGGNPNLLPEESESWSAGAIFAPRFAPGLRLSIDYTQIDKTDEIAPLTVQNALNLEDVFPGRVIRAALTPADAALGYTGGVITAVDTTNLNFARARVEAYDVQADYTRDTARFGTFNVYAVATWQPHFDRQSAPGTAFVNLAGFGSNNGTSGIVKWRGNMGLNWDRGPWTLGWNAQYYDSYFVYSSLSTPATQANLERAQGSDTIPSQLYHDLFAAFRFDDSMEIKVGIQNLFDEDPPIVATTGANGGYSTFADARLRRYSLSLRKSF